MRDFLGFHGGTIAGCSTFGNHTLFPIYGYVRNALNCEARELVVAFLDPGGVELEVRLAVRRPAEVQPFTEARLAVLGIVFDLCANYLIPVL
jgi:hypothetical protein